MGHTGQSAVIIHSLNQSFCINEYIHLMNLSSVDLTFITCHKDKAIDSDALTNMQHSCLSFKVVK